MDGLGERAAAELVLGVDAGTQSLKATVYDALLRPVASHDVEFDAQLASYGTRNGQIVVDGAAGVVRAPALMWFEALDAALVALAKRVDLKRVVAVSGCAQQHSSVWWRAMPKGEALDPARPLHEQLRGLLALELSPVWADASTAPQCRASEARVGGREAMSAKTGSVALERFTGNQIAKIAGEQPDVWSNTCAVQLLSTALCSVLVGAPVPSDLSDAAGMNMMDIRARKWLPGLERIFDAPGLDAKAGALCREPVETVGAVSDFAVARYGLREGCPVVAFTGDNPATLAGTTDSLEDVVISLGTSDTVLAQQSGACAVDTSAGGVSVFPHPLDAGMTMAMICYRNGGAVRAQEKGEGKSWADVESALLREGASGQDVVCFFFPQPETAPRPIKPCMRAFSAATGEEVALDSLSWEQRVRGVIFSRALSIRSHLHEMSARPKRLILTGGGSKSEATLAVFAQVLGLPAVRLRESGSASRGAALRALLATGLERPPAHQVTAPACRVELPEVPNELFQRLENLVSGAGDG